MKTYKVDYKVTARAGDYVLIDVYPTAAIQTVSAIEQAVGSIQQLIDSLKVKKPALKDISGLTGDRPVLDKTGCFVTHTPDGRTVLVGPDTQTVNGVYTEIKNNTGGKMSYTTGTRTTTVPKKRHPGKIKLAPAASTLSEKSERLGSSRRQDISTTVVKKNGLLVDKYLWMYMASVWAEKVKNVTYPYKLKVVSSDDGTRVSLHPFNERSAYRLTSVSTDGDDVRDRRHS